MTEEILTAAQINEKNIAVAEQYNASQGTVGLTEAEVQARAAEKRLGDLKGSKNHDGADSVVADTPESIAALEAAKTAEALAAKTAADNAAQLAKFEGKTPAELQKAQDEAIAAALAAQAAKTAPVEHKTETVPVAEAEGWMVSDSKEFNAALNVMKSEGMTPEDATAIFDSAINSGDAGQVDKAQLVEKLGADKAELVLAGFSTWSQASGADVLARAKNINDEAGGAENFQAMVAWAKGKAVGDDDFTSKVNSLTEMMNGSAFQGTMAVKEFASMYNADKSNSTLSNKSSAATISTNQAQNAMTVTTPSTAQVYSESVEDAQKNLRGAALATKMAELSASRKAGRNLGY